MYLISFESPHNSLYHNCSVYHLKQVLIIIIVVLIIILIQSLFSCYFVDEFYEIITTIGLELVLYSGALVCFTVVLQVQSQYKLYDKQIKYWTTPFSVFVPHGGRYQRNRKITVLQYDTRHLKNFRIDTNASNIIEDILLYRFSKINLSCCY